MAKFNPKASVKNTPKTTNRCGWPAYQQGDEERLVSAVLTCLVGEPKYYGSTDNDIVKLALSIAEKNPKFIASLAVYARREFHMRSVSHMLTAILAYSCKGKNGKITRSVFPAVVVRPDDMTEILSCYLVLFSKPIPNALKKGLSDALTKVGEYGLAKYRGERNALKMRDLIRLIHPKPLDDKQSDLWRRLIADELETPATWETELSRDDGVDKKIKWEKLINENKLGYMALLRNLRNLILADVSQECMQKIYTKLSDKDEVKKNKLLPFRYLSAYKELQRVDKASSKIFDVLEEALELSIDNMEKFKGVTAVVVDVSGSMDTLVSSKSKMTCAEIGLLLGVMASKLCEEHFFLTFDTGLYRPKITTKGGILTQVKSIEVNGGGTNVSLPFQCLLDTKIKVDRILLLSDNQANCGIRKYQSIVDEYIKVINKDVVIHAVDMQGYGSVVFDPHRKNINFIAGWSEKILTLMSLFEEGMGTLVKTIKGYDYTKGVEEDSDSE